jgi:DNA-binding phage protein
MSYTSPMDKRKQLAELLKARSALKVAKLSGLSVKTVYRMRAEENSPNMDTADKLFDACKKVLPKGSPTVARMKAKQSEVAS